MRNVSLAVALIVFHLLTPLGFAAPAAGAAPQKAGIGSFLKNSWNNTKGFVKNNFTFSKTNGLKAEIKADLKSGNVEAANKKLEETKSSGKLGLFDRLRMHSLEKRVDKAEIKAAKTEIKSDIAAGKLSAAAEKVETLKTSKPVGLLNKLRTFRLESKVNGATKSAFNSAQNLEEASKARTILGPTLGSRLKTAVANDAKAVKAEAVKLTGEAVGAAKAITNKTVEIGKEGLALGKKGVDATRRGTAKLVLNTADVLNADVGEGVKTAAGKVGAGAKKLGAKIKTGAVAAKQGIANARQGLKDGVNAAAVKAADAIEPKAAAPAPAAPAAAPVQAPSAPAVAPVP